MVISPIRSYCDPVYPTHNDVDDCPDLLANVPARWLTNPAVLTALASVTMLSAANVALAGDQNSAANAPRVAPVFQHGNRRGEFGCSIISPPVFLSEDEAKQVINNEAKRLGVEFKPVVCNHSAKIKCPIRSMREELDGVDAKRNVAYAFVTMEDGVIPNKSSVYESSTIVKAQELAKKFGLAPIKQTVGVFYDPMPGTLVLNKDGNIDWKAFNRQEWKVAAEEAAKEQLRAQVRDFVQWLKAQGII